MSDYRGGHQPFAEGPTLDDMTPIFGEDVYTHPEWYAFGEGETYYRESVRTFLAARGCPDAEVTVWRAVPPGVDTINPGDWVALSEAYARQHAMQSDDPADDWPVYTATVTARDLYTGSGDILEWGYWGPPIPLTQLPRRNA